MLDERADGSPHLAARVADLLAEHLDRAALRPEHAEHELHQRRLPRAVETHERVHLARTDLEVDVVDTSTAAIDVARRPASRRRVVAHRPCSRRSRARRMAPPSVDAFPSWPVEQRGHEGAHDGCRADAASCGEVPPATSCSAMASSVAAVPARTAGSRLGVAPASAMRALWCRRHRAAAPPTPPGHPCRADDGRELLWLRADRRSDQRVVRIVDHELALASEVPVEGHLRHACTPGDLSDRGLVVPLLREQLERAGEQTGAGTFRLRPAAGNRLWSPRQKC